MRHRGDGSTRTAAAFLVCAAVLWLVPGVAHAQAGGFRPERPNRALFGGGYGATEQSLIFTGQLGAGVGFGSRGEAAPVNELGGVEPVGQRVSSLSTNWDGTLAYTVARERFSLGASGTNSSRYFPADGGTFTTGSRASLDAQVRVTPRTAVSARLGVAREPLSALSLLPGLEDGAVVPLVPLDYGIGDGRVMFLRQETSLGVTQTLSRRSNVSLSYHTHRARLTNEGIDRRSGGFLGSFSYSLAAGLSLRAGYGLDESVYEATETEAERRVRHHRIDVGVDYNRALSISRRTTLAFSTGSMVLTDQGRRRYELVGSAVLRREIGRSWYSSLSYNRDVEFVDVLTQPAVTDALTTSVSGLVGRRLGLAGDAGWSQGRVGVATTANEYGVYRAGASATIGLTSTVGLGVAYSYFQYQFDSPQQLSGTFENISLSRQTLRVSVNFFAPLFNRARRP